MIDRNLPLSGFKKRGLQRSFIVAQELHTHTHALFPVAMVTMQTGRLLSYSAVCVCIASFFSFECRVLF